MHEAELSLTVQCANNNQLKRWNLLTVTKDSRKVTWKIPFKQHCLWESPDKDDGPRPSILITQQRQSKASKTSVVYTIPFTNISA